MNTIETTRRWCMTLCVAALGLGASAVLAQQKTPLLVYTALETDAMKLYKDGFEKVPLFVPLVPLRRSGIYSDR